MNAEVVSLLLVEDDDVEIEAIVRGLRGEKIANPIVTASDGAEALQILRGQHREKTLTRPYLIFLDLNMPGMSGFEFLDKIRGDDRLKDSIIFVLTTSAADEDRSRAYETNIAGYMVKEEVGPGFKKCAEMLSYYWAAVTLPD